MKILMLVLLSAAVAYYVGSFLFYLISKRFDSDVKGKARTGRVGCVGFALSLYAPWSCLALLGGAYLGERPPLSFTLFWSAVTVAIGTFPLRWGLSTVRRFRQIHRPTEPTGPTALVALNRAGTNIEALRRLGPAVVYTPPGVKPGRYDALLRESDTELRTDSRLSKSQGLDALLGLIADGVEEFPGRTVVVITPNERIVDLYRLLPGKPKQPTRGPWLFDADAHGWIRTAKAPPRLRQVDGPALGTWEQPPSV